MAAFQKKKILLVDDDAVVTHLYRDALVAGGYLVETAPDGEAAVSMLTSVNPDLVLLDMMLPKMPGLLVLRHIRAEPGFGSTPVIVLSNGFLSKMMDMAKLAGANACIRKSDINSEQLVEVVGQTIANGSGLGGEPPQSVAGDSTHTQIFRKAVAPGQEASSEPGARSEEGSPLPSNTPSAPPESPFLQQAAPVQAPAPRESPGLRYAEPPRDHSVESAKNFQAEIRQAVLSGTPEMLRTLRSRLPASFKGNLPATWMPQFYELYRTIRSLSATVEVAGLDSIFHLCTVTESLLQELLEQSDNANASTLRTVVRALETLEMLFQRATKGDTEKVRPAVVLVVDDDRICRSTAIAAVEMAKMRGVSIDNPLTALAVLPENDFDIIFSDIEMPQKSGFDFAKEVRNLPNHKKTPVIFVTGLTDFETRAQVNFINDTDFIGKPVIMSELAVKALTYVLRKHLETQ